MAHTNLKNTAIIGQGQNNVKFYTSTNNPI